MILCRTQSLKCQPRVATYTGQYESHASAPVPLVHPKYLVFVGNWSLIVEGIEAIYNEDMPEFLIP